MDKDKTKANVRQKANPSLDEAYPNSDEASSSPDKAILSPDEGILNADIGIDLAIEWTKVEEEAGPDHNKVLEGIDYIKDFLC